MHSLVANVSQTCLPKKQVTTYTGKKRPQPGQAIGTS